SVAFSLACSRSAWPWRRVQHARNCCWPLPPRRFPATRAPRRACGVRPASAALLRSEEHTSELQSHLNLVCRLLLEKKKNKRAQSQIQVRRGAWTPPENPTK